MLTIDSDGHLHEPFDLFDRYIEKEFHALRPRVIDMRGEARDQGRWVAEGRVVPRIPFSRGVGGGGFNYPTPRHKQMKARDNSLDDIPGRLDDLDLMGVDYQVVFPTALVWVFDLENAELAGAVCRAYNNYVAEQCSQASKRLNAIAMVPIQDPVGAAEEARRAVGQLGLAGVLLPGMAGNRPLHGPEYEPFFRRRGRARHPHRLPRGDRYARHAVGRLLHRLLLHPRHRHAVLHDGGDDVGGASGHPGALSQPALRLPGDRRHLVPLLGLVGRQAHRACPGTPRRRTPRGQLGPGALHPAGDHPGTHGRHPRRTHPSRASRTTRTSVPSSTRSAPARSCTPATTPTATWTGAGSTPSRATTPSRGKRGTPFWAATPNGSTSWSFSPRQWKP